VTCALYFLQDILSSYRSPCMLICLHTHSEGSALVGLEEVHDIESALSAPVLKDSSSFLGLESDMVLVVSRPAVLCFPPLLRAHPSMHLYTHTSVTPRAVLLIRTNKYTSDPGLLTPTLTLILILSLIPFYPPPTPTHLLYSYPRASVALRTLLDPK
jgi:hypothetical protein